ncbi:MAG: SusC/RagA family TonB-linked outer membrane protein [Bacteroides sp.]|nr:SusC/RagA family TonB-linked outer membrane protein [Bacteroides sp.]
MIRRILAMALIMLSFTANSMSADDRKVSVTIEGKTLTEALAVLQNESGYSIFYSSTLPDKDAKVNVKADGMSIREVLDALLAGLDISYEIRDNNQVVLFPKQKGKQSSGADGKNKIEVTGTVTDAGGFPVIGAGVTVEGTVDGTVTDADGKYSIEVDKENVTLYFSSLGYASQSVSVGTRRVIDVVLREDVQYLDEVVVVGYGVQKKVNLTGSVSMVSNEDMAARPVSDVASGLQGLLPGVTITNPSGQPGEATSTIRVRGIGTIGNSNPLVLVDGVEGDINSLNPEDIESVSVLKDAASSAIYGARAANGVLLVTTKKLSGGKDVPTRINFGAYFGFQTPTRMPEMLGAVDFMLLDNEARENVGTAKAWQQEHFDKVTGNIAPNYFGDTDWVESVLNKYAPQQNYNLSFSGTIGNSGYMLSYRYFDQKGLTKGDSTGEKRHNLRFKIDTRMFGRVTLSSNLGYTNKNVTSPVNSLSNGGGAIYNAMRTAPNVPVRYTDGTWAYGGGNTNPLAVLEDGGRSVNEAEEFSLVEVLKVDILKGWNVSATYSLTSANGLRNILKKTIVFKNPENGSTYLYNSPNSLKNIDLKSLQQTFIVQTNFDFTFGKHTIGGVAGMSQEWFESSRFEASRTNLSTEDDPTLGLGDPSTMSNAASASSWAIRSGFGRLNYNYDERYLLEVNLRYDLSSRFHKSHRGGFFPSVSAGWRLSEEAWMKFAKPLFDNIKFRVSYGELGNQYVGSSNYPYLSVLDSFTSDLSLVGSQASAGYVQSVLANPNLTWETIRMFDVGVDIAMLNNRLTMSFDWYNKNTSGILLQLNYPAQIGGKPSEENAGKVNNKGWELDMGWRDQAGDFSYGIGFNLSDVKNKITDLAGNAPDLSKDQVRIVGQPIDAFYGYIAEGLMTPDDFKISDPATNTYDLPNIPVILGNQYQPGDIKYKDISGPEGKPDGRITPEYDKVIIGSNIPRYTYSVRGNLGWKGIDFSFVIQGVGKCDGFLQGTARHAFQDMSAYPQKVHLQRYNVVSNPDPGAAYPRLTYNTGFNQNTFSTYWLENAAYLRLKNVQLGYTFPEKWMSKARIDRLRLYVSGDNLLTFSDFFYAYDPETPVSKGGYYPQVKTFVIGLNITFK